VREGGGAESGNSSPSGYQKACSECKMCMGVGGRKKKGGGEIREGEGDAVRKPRE
jgi:hypothetical protein